MIFQKFRSVTWVICDISEAQSKFRSVIWEICRISDAQSKSVIWSKCDISEAQSTVKVHISDMRDMLDFLDAYNKAQVCDMQDVWDFRWEVDFLKISFQLKKF